MRLTGAEEEDAARDERDGLKVCTGGRRGWRTSPRRYHRCGWKWWRPEAQLEHEARSCDGLSLFAQLPHHSLPGTAIRHDDARFPSLPRRTRDAAPRAELVDRESALRDLVFDLLDLIGQRLVYHASMICAQLRIFKRFFASRHKHSDAQK